MDNHLLAFPSAIRSILVALLFLPSIFAAPFETDPAVPPDQKLAATFEELKNDRIMTALLNRIVSLDTQGRPETALQENQTDVLWFFSQIREAVYLSKTVPAEGDLVKLLLPLLDYGNYKPDASRLYPARRILGRWSRNHSDLIFKTALRQDGYLRFRVVEALRSEKNDAEYNKWVSVLEANTETKKVLLLPLTTLRDWEELKGFEGVNISTSPEVKNLAEQFLNSTIPGRKDETSEPERDLHGPPRPCFLWSYPTKLNRENYLLLEFFPQVVIHSETHGRLTCYSRDGALLHSTKFLTGYGADFTDADLIRESWLGVPLLGININRDEGPVNRRSDDPPWKYRDDVRAYYAIKDYQPVVVRIEDNRGRASRNAYYAPNLVYGQTYRPRSLGDVIRCLNGPDKVDILKTLTWLGGRHLTPKEVAENGEKPTNQRVLSESAEEAQAFASCAINDKVKRAARRLCQSPDPWIREAAVLATVPASSDPRY